MNALTGRPMPAREIAPPPANIEVERAPGITEAVVTVSEWGGE
jgi:hypothetical protein